MLLSKQDEKTYSSQHTLDLHHLTVSNTTSAFLGFLHWMISQINSALLRCWDYKASKLGYLFYSWIRVCSQCYLLSHLSDPGWLSHLKFTYWRVILSIQTEWWPGDASLYVMVHSKLSRESKSHHFYFTGNSSYNLILHVVEYCLNWSLAIIANFFWKHSAVTIFSFTGGLCLWL